MVIRHVNFVAIQFREVLERRLLGGDVLGDLRQKVLRQGLTDLSTRMSAPEFGDQARIYPGLCTICSGGA